MDVDASVNQSLTHEDSDEQPAAARRLDEYLTDEYNYQAPRHGDIRTGVVVDVNEQGAIMDIGFKREGFVPAEDLTRLDEEVRSEVQIGAAIRVFVIRPEDQDGRPVLSIHQAYLYQDWIRAEEMMKSGELYEGEVSGCNRGGLIVRFGKIRGFVPASQVVGLPKRLREEQRRQRLSAMIGQQIGLRIIEVDRQRRRLIFSQRRALRAWQELQRERVMAQLTGGETRHGKVTSLTDFGAFVDLGGADGLIHVSELSWRRVENPREVLRVGQEVDVYVLNVDRERKRIALSLKKLQPDPWTLVDDRYSAGQLVEGRVTRVLDFGAFVELDLGVEGLLHAREMIGTPELSPSDIVHPGDKLPVKVVRIDSRRRRLDLSARQVQKDEWERWMAEQQAAREAQAEAIGEVAAAGEVAEEEAAAPEAEAVTGKEAAVAEAAAEEVAAAESDEAVGEAVEEAAAPEVEAAVEEITAPETEEAVGEAVEEAAAPEAGAAVEEITAPETEKAVGEAVEEAAAPEAEAAVEEITAPETEEAVGDAVEEAVVPEAETTAEEGAAPEVELAAADEAVAEEEATALGAEAAVGEAAEAEAEAPEAGAATDEASTVAETAEEEATTSMQNGVAPGEGHQLVS
jgi:small subunit ribosomal protein S1